MRVEFPDLTFDWKGYELLPEGMDYTPAPPDPEAERKPPIPSRLELLLAADGLVVPVRSRPFSRSRLALEGAEFAAEAGRAEAYHDAVYHAYWEEDRDIADVAVLMEAAERAGLDLEGFRTALTDRRYHDRVVEFDAPAHEAGVWNVPTWMFPDGWIAEQPYVALRAAVQRMVTR